MGWDSESESDKEVKVTLPISAKAKKWEDEDIEEVEDDWDAEENPVKKVEVASPKTTKKKGLKAKLAEKEALGKKDAKVIKHEIEETELERKNRIKREMEASDLENAKDLFGDATLNNNNSTSGLDSMNPKTRTEFDQFLKALSDKFSTFENSVSYPYFVENLVRNITISLSLDDSKKVSSSLTALISEKQKMQAAEKKGKKKKGPTANLKFNEKDTTNYGNEDLYAGEYDDFM